LLERLAEAHDVAFERRLRFAQAGKRNRGRGSLALGYIDCVRSLTIARGRRASGSQFWIERFDVAQKAANRLCDEGELRAGWSIHLVGLDGRVDRDVTESERSQVVRNDRDRQDFWYIKSRFPRQRPLRACERPEVIGVVPPHDRGEAHVTHVETGERQVPAPKACMQFVEERRCRIGRGRYAESLIEPAIDRQSIDLRGFGHELP
jgi:hypothetical protein